MKTLKNEFLTIAVEDHGAELSSIRKGEHEYLWNADPAFWKRHSPVLFPIVGSVWGGVYRSQGNEFKLGQHGFARDMDFTLVSESADELWYELNSSEETLAKYPYAFKLRIGYKLRGNEIDVMWRVENPSDKEMSFQIGAHPAFYYQPGDYFLLTKDDKAVETLCSEVITEGGCVDPAVSKKVETPDGYLLLDEHTFDDDALVLPNSQLTCVSICDKDKHPYLTVRFTSPLVGLWSPPHKNAPFVCIEPWYGRCDEVRYAGDYEHKPHIQHLGAHGVFEVKYTIIV